MGRIYKWLTIIFILLHFSSPVWAQLVTIVNYDFNTGESYGTLNPSLASNVTSTASSTENWQTYAGIASGASAFTANSTAGNALGMTNSNGTNTKYFQFQLDGSALSDYIGYKLYLQARRSSTGAQTITLAYSTDGSSYSNFGTTMSPGNDVFIEQVFDLTSITTLDNKSNVYFRLMASGASGTGTLRIDNFQVGATNLPAGTPSITVGSLSSFGNVVINTTSAQLSYTISGSNLNPASGNITVTPPTGFEISLTNGSGYSSTSIDIAYNGSALASTTVYVVFKPTLAQAYSGNITNAGGGATTKNVAVNGTGVNPTVIYRSAATGNWDNIGSWESSINNGTTWSAASAVPSSSDESISIRSGHIITVTSPVTTDQLIIDANGQITIASGQTLTIANGTGTDLAINGTLLNSGTLTINSSVAWEVNAGGNYIHNTSSSVATLLDKNPSLNAASNWIYRGASGSAPALSIANRTYGNLKIESTSGSMSISSTTGINPLTINGNFTIGAAGAGTVSYTTSGFTGAINISGNLEIGSNSILTVGTSTISIGGNWINNGTFNFGLSTVLFNGSSGQQISGANASNFYRLTLNNVNGLQLNKDAVINDVLTLTNGSFSIGSNTLTLNGTITKTNGSLTGGISSNLIVSGSTDQLNLPEVNLNNLQLNRLNGIALGGNLTINGLLTLTSGVLSIGGNTLTLNGALSMISGGMSGGITSNIVIGGTGGQITIPALSVNDFTLNRSNGVILGGDLSVNGNLQFTAGILNTQNNSVLLGASASISGETSSRNVIGSIITTRNVGTSSSTFGNIGVEINAGGDDLGNVSVTRISGTAVSVNSSQGIKRKWIISSANPPTNGRNLSLIWLSNDDNGKNLASMQVWKSSDGVNWVSVGPFQDVSATRKITLGVTAFSDFTASDNLNPLASPSAPTNLAATPLSVSEINLSWTDNSTIETGFKIERKLGAVGVYAEIAVVGANVTNYTDVGLNDNTQCYYRVRSYNSAGNSNYSNESNATTFLAVPQTPSNLTATSSSTSSINLSWSDNSTNEEGFKIERKLGAAGSYVEIGV
ncbi:MAG: fibronectin type III domain-containing protein, partial [Bacteroidetes bacterium]|nr:fibronectin type III domain-containing protein [Bacteroidota bacterium]